MKKYYYQYSALFLLFALFIFSPFLLKGNSFVNVGDSYDQFYPAFVYAGDYGRSFVHNLLQGHIKQYDFSIGFGDDVTGVLNYYGFGSLFSLLSIFAPPEYSVLAYTLTILLKMYLSGITFSYYLFVKNKCIDKKAAMVSAFTYVFSGYSLFYGLQFSNFLDVFVYLPLAIAGIEKIVREKGKRLIYPPFLLAFCFQALSGFYHLYMLTLFGVIYFIVCCLTRQNEMEHPIKKFILAAINYLSALSLSACIFLPSMIAYFKSTRVNDNTFRQLLFTLYDKETVLGNLVNIFLKPGYQASLGISILSGLAVIILICRKKGGTWKEYKIMLSIFGTGYFLPVFGSIMNGFSYATDRWSFILVFLLAALTGEILSDHGRIQKKEILVFAVSAFLWTLFYWKEYSFTMGNILGFSIYAAMWIFVLLLLLYMEKRRSGCLISNKAVYLSGLFFIAASSFMMNAPVRIGGGGWSAYFMPFKSVYHDIINSNANVEDDGLFRVDICDTSEGSSLILHNKGTTSYYSITNKNIYSFFRELKVSSGISTRSFRMKGLDNRDIIRKLLAVKYIDKDGQVLPNTQYEGFGLLFDTYCKTEDIMDVPDIDKNLLIDRTVILEEDPDGNIARKDTTDAEWSIEPLEYTLDYVNIEGNDGILKVNDGGNLDLSVESGSHDRIYLMLKGLEIHNKELADIRVNQTSIRINGGAEQEKLHGDKDYLVFADPADGKINISLDSGEYSLEGIEIYSVDYENFPSDERNKIGDVSLTAGINQISGTINAHKDCLLFLSIPYDNSWEFLLDGETIKTYQADWGFTALEIPGGQHGLEGKYHSPGMKTGIILGGEPLLFLYSYFYGADRRTDNTSPQPDCNIF